MTNARSTLSFAVRIGTLAALLGLCMAEVNAASLEVPAKVKERGYLLVGIESTYPPMAYKDPATNERVGFNVDLVNALGKEIGLPIKFEEMSFEQLMASVTTGRIDVIGTAMSDLPSRREKLTFVNYLSTGAQMFTTVANGQSASDATDFCGKKIGTPRSTSFYGETQSWSERSCSANGKPAAQVMGISGATATRIDLKQARLDAAVLGPEYVSYLMKQEPNTYVPVGRPISQQLLGLAVAKGDNEMRDLMADALEQVLRNGDYQQALSKYGLESQAVSEVTINSGE